MAASNKNSVGAKKKTSGASKTSKTKSSGKSASGTKKSGSVNNRKKTALEVNPYQDEIIVIIALVIAILFALSTFDLCGIFGQWVGYFLFGVFGVLAYLMPYLLFLGVAFSISNRGNRSVQIKIGCCAGVYVVAVALAHMFTHGYEEGADILAFYTESATLKSGGGILGGAIGTGLASVFGQAGTYVILFGTGVGLLILITEKLLFAGVREKSVRSKERFDARREAQREEREAYREQKALERVERPKAKVFNFSQADSETLPNTPFRVFGVKKEGNTEKVSVDTVTPTGAMANSVSSNMEHLAISRGEPDVIEEMTITREGTKESEERAYTNIPVYQEELNQKFKNSSKSQPILPKGMEEIQAVYVEDISEEAIREDIAEEVAEELSADIVQTQETETQDNRNDNVIAFRNSAADRFFEKVEREMQEEKLRADLESQMAENTEADESDFVEEDMDAIDMAGREVLNQIKNNESTIVEKTRPAEIKESGKEKAAVEKVNTKEEVAKVDAEINTSTVVEKPKHVFPPMHLLAGPKGNEKSMSDQELKNTAMKLQSTLESFGVRVEMKNVSCGPTVTRYELQPAQGVKVSKITSLTDDIKLSLAAADIRIEAPIPGKSAVGIEVPNTHNSMVYLRTLLESPEFKEHKSNIAIAVGKDIGGKTIVTDIAKMPHLLIAGATGSGKSVFINTLIMSILYKAHPDDVKLIMVDPKVVELSIYNGIPHLLIPVVTDPKKASGALNWAVMEMTERYKKFADLGVRDLKGYNEKVSVVEDSGDERFKKLPQIVIIVDELADLMMVAPGEVEDAICRLAQLARACGIHLVIATQRPSVNVITGVIKANIPSRVAFAVSSAIDSRTILDGGGAEKLLGNGDMLFFPSGFPKPIRVQGSFVSDKEVSAVVDFLKEQNGVVEYNDEVTNKITTAVTSDSGQAGGNERDEHFVEAGKFVIERDKASIGVLQRVFKVGYNRAARIMDQLYDAGVVGPEEGTKPRKVIMSMEQFEEYVDEYV